MNSRAALGYYVSEDGYPGWYAEMTWIPRELPGGCVVHSRLMVEDGHTCVRSCVQSAMEQMKMSSMLQSHAARKSAIVKAMYAATIESELDTQSAMDFILGANSQEQRKG